MSAETFFWPFHSQPEFNSYSMDMFMKPIKTTFSSLAILLILSGCSEHATTPMQRDVTSPMEPSTSVKAQAKSIVAKMTIEEKIQIVSGMGMSATNGSQGDFDRVPGTAGYTHPVPSVGLKSIALADGPAGLRIWPERENDPHKYYATAFPVASAVASTWDISLVNEVGQAMGNEVKEYGVDVLLAPGMNIHRNPRTGRNFEYYSEDPLLSGTMAAAMVNGVESNGVGATIKHFVANNQETNRMGVDAQINERALREIYLKGFQIAVEQSHPWAVMSAYNSINGHEASENKALLTDVLRNEWGFDGLVMTDWFAGKNPATQLKAGNDLLMPGLDDRTEMLKLALQQGDMSQSELDVNVTRIVEMILKSPTQAGYTYSNTPDLNAHAQVARSVAAQGVVLLKNTHGTLPLGNTVNKVGAFGIGSYAYIAGGTGSGDVNEAYTVSLVDGLKNANIEVDSELGKVYTRFRAQEKAKQPPKASFFTPDSPLPEMPVDATLLEGVVARTDIGLITLGRNSGEFADRELAGDFYLTDAEQNMINDVATAYHNAGKKVVVVLNIGNVIEMASWRDAADAIVLPWQGGQEAGNAVTDVLTGKVNPSGKLPTTFPLTYDDVPSAEPRRFPGFEKEGAKPNVFLGIEWGKPATVWYEEGIFVGYRYYDSFNVPVAYPFGFGLSYTNFTLNSPLAGKAFPADSKVVIPVTVTNNGDVAGKQVVQLYVSAPQDGLIKPNKELRAFAKSGLLQPGESQVIELTLEIAKLASFDPDKRAWVVAKGNYTFNVATSVSDVAFTATMTVQQSFKTESVSTQLNPVKPVIELTRN